MCQVEGSAANRHRDGNEKKKDAVVAVCMCLSTDGRPTPAATAAMHMLTAMVPRLQWTLTGCHKP
jgi:hypothetical protein